MVPRMVPTSELEAPEVATIIYYLGLITLTWAHEDSVGHSDSTSRERSTSVSEPST